MESILAAFKKRKATAEKADEPQSPEPSVGPVGTGTDESIYAIPDPGSSNL